MYKNVGKKIMVLAKIQGWLGLIAGIIVFIVIVVNDSDSLPLGLIFLIAGILLYISTWALYGFGQLVEDVHEIKGNLVKTDKAPIPLKPNPRQN